MEVREMAHKTTRALVYNIDQSAIYSIYNGISILVIGNSMSNIFEKLSERTGNADLPTRTGVYFVKEVNTGTKLGMGPTRGYMNISKNEFLRETEMIKLLDANGIETDEEIERVSNPDVKIMSLTDLVSDSDFRKGAELVAGMVDRTCATIIVSDFDDEFARKIHASLVTKIPVTREATASFVIRNRDPSQANVEAVTLINSIKSRMDNFVVVEKKRLMTKIPALETTRGDLEEKIIKYVMDFVDKVPTII